MSDGDHDRLRDADARHIVTPARGGDCLDTGDSTRIETDTDDVIEISHEVLKNLGRPLLSDEINSGRPGIIGMDFDNTITTENVAYWNGEVEKPDEEVIDKLKRRYHSGWIVVVWTARPWSEASTIAARLTEWGIPYHGIRCEKGSADLYVDDKCVRPEEFVRGEEERR